MGTSIKFTPSGSTEQDIEFDSTRGVLTRLVGHPVTDNITSVSTGGKAVSVVHDAWFEYQVDFQGLQHPTSASSAAQLAAWKRLRSWISHAFAGGEFKFSVDDTKEYVTTLSGAEADAQTVLAVTDSTGMTAHDFIYIEDATDPTKWENVKITTVDSSIQITTGAITRDYVTASVVRHKEYFPACVLIGNKKPILTERSAGKGVNIFDLRFKFRTVR